MKLEKLIGDRFKERPSDCVTDSHALMVRGGYMKNVTSGIYSSYTPLKRITRKIEEILRDEMEKIDGQEVSFPVVLPASLWEESGRYETVGSELLRFRDRNSVNMVLGMTHEEAAVHLVREYANSYTKYPFMIYQIQTKFRDEARPRAGLIRVREFTMKDGYSFHTTPEDLENYYKRCHRAYENIYARTGIPEVVSVSADSGMMGGSLPHEFILLTPEGEDSIVTCDECDFMANLEACENIVVNEKGEEKETEEVYTPDCNTIDDLCSFLNIKPRDTMKAVVYQRETDDSYVVLFIRGDYDVSETKLKNIAGSDLIPANITEESGIVAGFIGGLGFKGKADVYFDRTLEHLSDVTGGANREGYHMTGISMDRDFPGLQYVDAAMINEESVCPRCGKKSLTVKRGIEVGNIFQLGDKYTKSMGMTYLDEKGEAKIPVMGCYGMGVGRLAASVAEARHDDYGPIWPISIAPWEVHLCAMRSENEEVRETADRIYRELTEKGIEVIFDDRSVSAGVMFSDADLLGVPVRIIVSPRNLKEGACEVSLRDKSWQEKIKKEEVTETVVEKIKELKSEINSRIKSEITE